jgi:hypothetical protein
VKHFSHFELLINKNVMSRLSMAMVNRLSFLLLPMATARSLSQKQKHVGMDKLSASPRVWPTGRTCGMVAAQTVISPVKKFRVTPDADQTDHS